MRTGCAGLGKTATVARRGELARLALILYASQMTEGLTMDNKPEKRLESEVAAYRQPMVTSLGIILGFMLAFLANWASQASDAPAVETASDWLIFGALAVSIALLVVVLYRLLDNHVQPNPGERYQATVKLYMTGIVIAFLGLAAALVI